MAKRESQNPESFLKRMLLLRVCPSCKGLQVCINEPCAKDQYATSSTSAEFGGVVADLHDFLPISDYFQLLNQSFLF